MSFLSVPISLFPTKKRMIGSINVDVVINESTNDTLTVTKQPVQQGASISDHAYKEPTVFTATISFRDNSSNKPLSQIYDDLLALQASRVPFTIVTPKRVYANMLMTSLGQTTDKSTENSLAIILSAQETLIVKVTTTTVPRILQKSPGVTQKTEPAGKKSFLKLGSEGVLGALGKLPL